MRFDILTTAIVESILHGNYPDSLSLEKLQADIPMDWEEQRELFSLHTA